MNINALTHATQLVAATLLGVVSVCACASKPPPVAWAFSIEFQDAKSCSLMRRVEVYESGLILYYRPTVVDQSTRTQISSSDAQALIQMAKSFPVVEVGAAEDFVGSYKKGRSPRSTAPTSEALRNRGTHEDLEKLIDEIAKRTRIEWEPVPKSDGRRCEDRGYRLPSGIMVLREDMR